MNSKEVLAELATRLDKPQVELKNGWREAMVILRRGFAKGKGLTLSGFGTWRVKERKRRRAFHPVKRRYLLLPPKLRLTFRAGKQLRETINSRGQHER
jgi:nucleoid DNA-binding protein